MEKMLGDQIMGIERNDNQKSINTALYPNHSGDSCIVTAKAKYTKYEVIPSSNKKSRSNQPKNRVLRSLTVGVVSVWKVQNLEF